MVRRRLRFTCMLLTNTIMGSDCAENGKSKETTKFPIVLFFFRFIVFSKSEFGLKAAMHNKSGRCIYKDSFHWNTRRYSIYCSFPIVSYAISNLMLSSVSGRLIFISNRELHFIVSTYVNILTQMPNGLYENRLFICVMLERIIILNPIWILYYVNIII